MTDKEKAIERIKSLPEPEGWPGDVPSPFPLGRTFVSPKNWLQYADIEEVSLKNLNTVQPSVDREQVLELVARGAPDIEPLPIVTVFPDGEMLIEDGNHRLAAKVFLGHDSAKVRLINIKDLPEEVIYDAMDKGKITMRLFNQLIEMLVTQTLSNIIKEQIDGAEVDDPLYHVTYYNRLEGISQNGLQPGSARSIGGSSYDTHAARGIFLAEDDGVSFWYSKAEDFANHNSDNPLEDGLVPIVLKIDPAAFLEEDLIEDEPGSADSATGAYIVPNVIEPDYIEAWDGSSWIPVDEWDSIDIEQAFDREELEDEDGDEEAYYLFKYDNPLQP